jgi:hypothetical protein
MEPRDLIRYYPRLYHMAEDGTWDSIRERGLLSTASLLELFEIPEPQRTLLLTQHRRESVELSHPVHGRAVVRDQKPLSTSKLEQLLIDMTPSQWIELLNGFVFFWLDADRLSRLLNARAYRNRPHVVLTLDTRGLVGAYAKEIRLSHLNSGATPYVRGPRGSATFKPISEFRHPRSLRLPPKNVVELAVPKAVPDILQYTLLVERWQASTLVEALFVRS